jgi:arylsulfatase A-like enzyme
VLLGLVGALALAAGILGLRWSRDGRAGLKPARHVIIISLDTTRADHFGCYDHPWIRTPRIDALAAESILFTDCMTVAPSTLASHVSLFTATYPHTHGTPRNGFMVNQANVMLAEILQEAGFQTVGFAGAFSLDSRFGIAQGFDHYDERFDHVARDLGPDQDQRSAAAVTDAAIKYLDETGIPSRLFLFVHYFDPHAPYEPPPPFDTMYDAQLPGAAPAGDPGRDQYAGAENAAAQKLALQYAGELSFMDKHVGRLLDYLRQRGILDQALVVVTSDHGENFWEHETHFDHGLTTYQTTMRAICLIRLPHAHLGGTRVEQLVANIDLLPTLLSHLRLPVRAGIQGQAIDLMRADQSFPPRIRFGQATKPWGEVETDPRWLNMRKARCVRRGSLKLIQTPYAQTEELYDLSVDPQEGNNLLPAATPEIKAQAAELRRQLEAWAQSATPLPSRFEPSQRQETIERLRSLGYLGSE